MKALKTTLKTFVAAFLIITLAASCSTTSNYDTDNKENQEIVITKNTSKAQMDQLVSDLAAQGIRLKFDKLEFNSQDEIERIKGEVSWDEGGSGVFDSWSVKKITINRTMNPQTGPSVIVDVK